MNSAFRKIITPISILLFIASTLALTGCSGSSGGAPSLPPPPPPDAPTLALTVAMKQLQFSWDLVPGATYYRVNENANGKFGFTPVSGDLGAAAITYNHEISVHLQDWPNARYLVEACNASGCTASNEMNAVNSSVAAIGYFKASNSDAGDLYGASVAISGDGKTFAIGALHEDSNSKTVNGDETNQGATDSGAVYVYRQSTDGTWIKDAYIKGSRLTGSDWFGKDVSLSRDGNTLAISARRDELSTTDSGLVYIFTRDGTGNWSEKATLEATASDANDDFGYSISLTGNGDKLLVGAPFEDSDKNGVLNDFTGVTINNGKSNSGAAYLFTRNADESWSVAAYFKAAVTDVNDQFGWAVDISDDGTALVIGANGEDSKATALGGNANDNGAEQSGAAYVFSYESGSWVQKSFLKASNAEGGRPTAFPNIIFGDDFGYDVSISGDGNIIAVSAPWEQSNSIFDVADQNNNALSQAGAVYIFENNILDNWVQTKYLKASNTTPAIGNILTVSGDSFGRAISISNDGNLLAVGAYNEDSNTTGMNGDNTNNSTEQSGAVFTYSRNVSGDWNFSAYTKSSNPGGPTSVSIFGDGFGYGVSLSDDGSELAVSAWAEDSGTDVINGDLTDNSAADAGAVYLY